MRPLLLLTLLPFLALAEAPKAEAPPARDCPLCRTPNRAALFAGEAKKCPANCEKLCCKGTELTYQVRGMQGAQGAGEVRTALEALDGVLVQSVSHQSRLAEIRFDPAVIQPARIIATIKAAGYAVTGEQATFHIPTMTNEMQQRRNRGSRASGQDRGRHPASGGRLPPETRHALVIVFDPGQDQQRRRSPPPSTRPSSRSPKAR